MVLQDLDKIVEHHRLAYLGAEPHDKADTADPSRNNGTVQRTDFAWQS